MAKRHKKTGPKPKPVAEIRRHGILLKLNDAEFRQVKMLASGQPLASYVRGVVLTAA